MDGVMKEMGQCGRFQICHVTLVQLCRAINAWTFSLMIFGLYNPGWRCVQPNLEESKNKIHVYNMSSIHGNASSYLDTNDITARLDWPEIAVNMQYNVTAGNETILYEGTCDVIKSCAAIEFNPASSTIVTEFGLVCDKVWIGYIIVSVQGAGQLLGCFFWGRIGERYGRKISLYVSDTVLIISSGVAIFSPSWEVYAVFQFFMGFGATGVIATASPFCMEFLNSKWRARISSIPVWSTSVIGFAFVVYLFRDWRHILLANTLVGGVSLVGAFWTPESLRWLVLHGKTSRAEKVVRKVSKLNKRPMPKESFEKLIEQHEETESRHHTYLDLFRTRTIRSITLKLGFIGVTMSLVYEILGLAMQSLPGDFYTNIVVASLIELPGTLSVGLLATKLGRRWAGIVYMGTGTFCCATIVTSLLTLDGFRIGDILISTMAFINKATMQAISDLSYTYIAELVPTAIRHLTFSYFFLAGRVVGITGPFILPRDFPTMVAFFAVLMVFQLIAVCIYVSLPETKNKTIGDAIEIRNCEEDEKC